MSKKAVAATLLLTFVFALAPAVGDNGSRLGIPDFGTPAEIERASEPLLAATTGGGKLGCITAVLGFSFVALGVGAATGGAGLAIGGAYAPIALVFCK